MPHDARTPLHLAVALDGTGWHPAAWRAPDARPAALFTASYWVDLVQEAEAGLLDLVTFEDGLSLQSSRLSRPPADRPAAHAETLPDDQVESRPQGRVEA